MAFLHSSIIILLFISFFKEIGSKFFEIKSLSSGNYFVIFHNGLFIYNYNFEQTKVLQRFYQSISDFDRIIIKDHIFKENIYIFCIINNYLYIYDDSKEKIRGITIPNQLSNYKYFDIFPYNTNKNELNFILNSIIIFSQQDDCGRFDICPYYYFIYVNDYNINYEENEIKATLLQSQSINVDSSLFQKKNVCQILDSSFILKCIYYGGGYFINYQYNILRYNFQNTKLIYFSDVNFIEIASSKSYKDNYLICPLFLEKECNYNYCNYKGNFTFCSLCDKNNDFGNCNLIYYSYLEDCSKIKTFYFNNSDKFALICKKFNEFILLIIDHQLMNVISSYIIYINCIDNNGYNGEFSLIYNNSIDNYNLITEFNFTDNPRCSFNLKEIEEESFNFNQTRNITHMESENQEMAMNNSNIISNFSFDGDFFDIKDTIKFSESEEENKYSENIIIKTSEIISKVTNNLIINNNTEKESIIIIEKKTTNLTKEEIINNISEIMSDKEIGKTYEINGDDFTIIIKPTNSPRLPNTTHVEFDACEQRIRKEYNISNETIITFFQIEIDNENDNALYNQIKYTIYDDELKEIDLSLCNDIDTQIHFAIKERTNLDLKSASNFKNLGVDVLDINDDFFNNLCHAFADGDKDMILEDRIKYIFQNYSLCEEGCSYNSLDIETKSITCDCKIQGNLSTITSPLVFTSGKESSIFDSNIGVSKCYNLVFSFSNKNKNIGFIFFTILIIAYIVFIIIQIKKGIKPICDYLHKEMITHGYLDEKAPNFFEYKINESNKSGNINALEIKDIKEKIEEEKNEVNDDNQIKKLTKFKKKKSKRKKKKKKSINLKGMDTLIDYQQNIREELAEVISDKSSKIYKLMKKKKIKTKKVIKEYVENNNFGIIRIDLNNIKEYYPLDSNQSLHNYSFDEAIKYDRRNIFRVFYIYLLSKQIIFRTFLQRSPLELFYLRFTLFIFMLSCDLALNALFYFNDNISKKYHYAQNLFLFTFSNNITIIIYSTLISSFLLTLLSKLSNSTNAIRNVFRKEEEKIQVNKKKYEIKEETKKQIFNDVENILKKYKIKILVLLIIQTVLILFFWYFVTAFCHVYSSTQASWLLDSFLSILSRLMLELIFGFLYAKLYQVSVGANIETFYKILLCIYDFS